jgi:hypothetical protein
MIARQFRHLHARPVGRTLSSWHPSRDELQEVYARLRKAGGNIIEQGQTTCCYAKSEKSCGLDDLEAVLR